MPNFLPLKKRSDQTAPTTQEKRRRSVIYYIAVLFAVAFLLLLLTYWMDRRAQDELVNTLTQSVTGLRESISSIQSAQDAYGTNLTLMGETKKLNEQIYQLEQQMAQLTAQSQQQSKALEAMDWFWQLNEAFVKEQYTKARELADRMEEQQLVSYLPTTSHTANGRFSPLARYREIREKLTQ